MGWAMPCTSRTPRLSPLRYVPCPTDFPCQEQIRMVLTLHDITSNLREGVDPVPRSAMNLVPSIIIQSPLHALMSSKYAMIEFSGRKTGRTYKTPIAYVRDGNQLLMSTDSPWHRNLAGGAQVRMRLRS